jgi:16S rRNA (guanine966-N2)-methyltransferase
MGQIRIIAGSLKGRRIEVPEGQTLRPTADRVREALFSILGGQLAGAVVLDAYAGSGALGLEALSRGAARVVFLEGDRRAVRALESTLGRWGVGSSASVVPGPVARSLRGASLGGPFDLILADPPYREPAELVRFLPLAAAWLRPEGQLVLERPFDADPAEGPGLRLVRSSRYGRCRLDFYRPA